MRAEMSNARKLSLSPSVGTTSLRPAALQGAKGEDGSNVLPTDVAISNAIEDEGSDTYAALSDTIETVAKVPQSIMSRIAPATADTTIASPADLPGLALWLNADDLLVADNTAVPTWYDASGHGRHANTEGASNPPTLRTNVLDGHNVIRFSAAGSQALKASYGGEPGTVIVIGKQNTGTTGHAAFLGAKGTGPGFIESWYLRARNIRGYAEFCRSNQKNIAEATLDPFVSAQNRLPLGQFNIYMATLDAGSRVMAFYEEGYAQRVRSSTPLSGIAGELLIGAGYEYHAAEERLTGDIAQVIIFNRVLKDNELDAIGAWIVAEYPSLDYTPIQPLEKIDAPLVLSSFHYDGDNKSRMLHILTSDDGLAFHAINGVTPVYSCPHGEVKDTSIRYDHNDGYWYVVHSDHVATGQTFGLARSRDLRVWETLGPVDMSAIAGLDAVWAPDWFVDPTTGITHVLFSASTDGLNTFECYESHPTTPGDYSAWSTPVQIGPTGTGAIDYHMQWINNTYYLWYKGPGYPEILTSATLTGTYAAHKSGNWGGWPLPNGNGYEGPSVVRFAGKWHLYADDGHLKVSTSDNDFMDPPYTDFVECDLFPAALPVMNHGTVTLNPVTEA